MHQLAKHDEVTAPADRPGLPFRLPENSVQRVITVHLLGTHEVGELLLAA